MVMISDEDGGSRLTAAAPSTAAAPWDLQLIRQQGPGSLVAIGREGRLARQTSDGTVRVGLTIVDETVLALVDLALRRRRNLTIVYPAPAGEVSVLLAAEILLQRFIRNEPSQSVGIVTADAPRAQRLWEELAIKSGVDRAPLSEVFPVFRAGPSGESPVGGRRFRGALIGRRFVEWPVDAATIDYLSGPAEGDPTVPSVRVFADPLDPELNRLAADGELIWGWAEADLATLTAIAEQDAKPASPFSVATERLATMAAGVKTTIHVAHQVEAEKIIRRLRDDLRTLKDLAGAAPPSALLRGIRVAWHHVSTLTALPCRPSEFDDFAGIPPIAARDTRTFELEIAAWARTLDGDLREVAEIVASDLGDLRSVLEGGSPFAKELSEQTSQGGSDTLIVVSTQTAARALIKSLKGDPTSDRLGSARVVAIRRLHTMGTWAKAVFVGIPAPWDWHRLDSGLSLDLHVLLLGDLDAYLGRKTLERLREARAKWSGHEIRKKVWCELVRSEPPPEPNLAEVAADITVVNALETKPEIDPFESLQPLLLSTPLAIGEEGIEETMAREASEGEWQGAVDAVEVVTDAGIILLPRDQIVDIRKGDEITDCRAEVLQPGMVLIVDRRGGRLGLLEAVANRLQKERPDLIAANLLIRGLRESIQRGFASSGLSQTQLFEKLRSLGFEKTYQAARSYVDEDGPLAPRDIEDLYRLNEALELGMSVMRLREVFAGVKRWRTFRRATGRALVAASRGSLLASDVTRVDPETGLSLADLQELVLEATVVEVSYRLEQVPFADVGWLREA